MKNLNSEINKLKNIANTIRQDIIKMLLEAGSGHSAGPLGMADIFSVLYFHTLKHNPQKPDWQDRDRLVLSNGHICPVLYSAMARSGYFPIKELMTLRKINSRLQGHPHNKSMPGIENSSGPLGQGISQATGMALAALMDNKKCRIYCITGDGEHNEGQVWEAIMFAGKMKLHNLCGIVDRNNIQIDGYTEEIMPLEPFKEKYEAFGWHVLEIDGHNIEHVIDALEEAKTIKEKPTVIIAHTIPGKGVSFMENLPEWHGKPPNIKEAKLALKELGETHD